VGGTQRRFEADGGDSCGAVAEAGVIVSVIVPVYNVEPYLRECLDSVLTQSIGLDRLELIAVDDGSTDGSAEILDFYADLHPNVHVFHEPNSGGPGRPRNVGLDHASGRYVFFLDADDYLGREALERLVDMAERNRSDVVLGKMVGVSGRRVPGRAFRRTRKRAKLTDVYMLNVLKLFRRALIERLSARFDETVSGGEDGPFAAELLLSARVVSVVANYRCYYCRDRPGSQTKRRRTEDPADYAIRMSRRAQLLAKHRPPSWERDRLMARHIRDMMRPFYLPWLSMMPDDRRRLFEVGQKLLNEWSNERIEAMLSPFHALRSYCLRHGLLAAMEDIVRSSAESASAQRIVINNRVFANFPHFRDEYKIPDSYFELTRLIELHSRIKHAEVTGGKLILGGKARLSYLGGGTSVVLKRWPWGEAHRYATEIKRTETVLNRYPAHLPARFTAEIDLTNARNGRRLSPGPWQIRLEVGPKEFRREAPAKFAKRNRPVLPTVLSAHQGSAGEATLYRAADGSLRLRMGGPTTLRTWLEMTTARVHPVTRRARRRLRRRVRKLRAWLRKLRRRVRKLGRRAGRLLRRVYAPPPS
jgi:CDP-glycerol glycerophosphotransferase